MPRLPRLEPRGRPQSYHLYNRLAGEPGFPRPGSAEPARSFSKSSSFLRDIIRQDEADGYSAGAYLQNQRYMNDAQALRNEEQIRALHETLVARGVYRQVRSPVRSPVGSLVMLRGHHPIPAGVVRYSVVPSRVVCVRHRPFRHPPLVIPGVS